MFGAVMDALTLGPKNMMMEEDRNQRQQDAWGMAQYNQEYNSAQSALQRDWTETMANTAYQRQVADMRKAGINPMLAATKGGGAPSGGGSSASSSGSGGTGGTSHDVPAHFTQAQLNSAMEAQLHEQKIKTTQEQYNVSADTEKKKQETNLLLEQEKTQQQLTHSARHNANILAEDEKGKKLEGGIDETKYGEIMRFINRAMRAITGGASAYGHTVK